MPKLNWTDIEDIALALRDKYPDQDPSFIRFTDLHKWITELDGFDDDPKKSNESKLEAIQRAWLEEFNDE
jgi:FeS assembly protein IscX